MLPSDELWSPLRYPFSAFVAYLLISGSCFPQFAGVRFLNRTPDKQPRVPKPVFERVWFVLPQVVLDESNVGQSLSFPIIAIDNLMGYLGNPQSANGAGVLGHVFGTQQSTIEGNLAQATGMDQNSASGLLQTIAPPVMGAVGQAQQQNALDATDLSNLLNSQQRQARANAPDAMGMLGSMLDQNQDGSAMDDLQHMAANFFK